MSGLWKPQLGPADETPYKIDRADIVLEDLTAGLRGDLSLLEAQLARASESGPLPPATEAMYRKRIAQTSYKLWEKTLDHSLIPPTLDKFTLALAFPANAVQPLLWWEAANLYLSQGAYEGAMAMFNRIALDFADYPRINAVLMSRAATLRRLNRFDEAITDFLHVIRTKIPSPYTFGDIMTHIAWCYELKGDAIDSKLIRDEAKGAFATAFQSLTEKPADAMTLFGKDISSGAAWVRWRRTPLTWLRLASKHSDCGHIALSADCFNEAARLRELQNIEEAAAAAKAAEAARTKAAGEADAAAAAAVAANTLSPYQKMLAATANAKARALAKAEAEAEARRRAEREADPDASTTESESSDEESFDKEGELEREQDERWAMEDEEKLSKDYEAICAAEAARVPPAPAPPSMRANPPDVPQPATKWSKNISFDEVVRAKLPPKVRRPSAVEEAGLWMVASDVYLREDKNEAAHVAAEAAVRGAHMGDITASAALALLSKSSSTLSELLQKRAAAHLLSLSMRWVNRVRLRIKQRLALKLIIAAYRQHRYRLRHYARVMIQSRVKAYLNRRKYRAMRAAVPPIQCWWRMLLAIWEKCRLQRTRVRWALMILQRNIRWFVHRQTLQEWLIATTLIQRKFREFQARVRAFMWERYHFFAAQELEHWVGCNVGCVIVPKKFVRQYEPSYRVPVLSSNLGQHESLPAMNLAAITLPKRAVAELGVTRPRSSDRTTNRAVMLDNSESEGIPRVLWLHPSDRIVRRRVIPTRIEMLAEIRVWGRAEHIAEMLAFADVNVQQGAIWGYNDGEPELEEWGGFRTLYLQMRALRGNKVVGKATTDPDSVSKDGGERIRGKPKAKGAKAGGDADDESKHAELLQNPGVERVRKWMQEVKGGLLPSWNRGLPAVWEAFTSGRGTRYYKGKRGEWSFQSPHVCAEAMHPVKAARTSLMENSLELTASVPPSTIGVASVSRSSAGGVEEEPETIFVLEGTEGASMPFRSLVREPKMEYTRTLASTGGAGASQRASSAGGRKAQRKGLLRTLSMSSNRPTDGTQAGRQNKDALLTPVQFVQVGLCKDFKFEYCGRWGCDLKYWTKGSERYLWDLQLWGEAETWGFPYGSKDQFMLYQRWLSQLPLELRVWAKKGVDWRTVLDEQLQTGLRFAQRSYRNSLRECVARRVFDDDYSGWYAGWVRRPRKGTVAGAVGPAKPIKLALGDQTDADKDILEEEDEDDPAVRLAMESTAVQDSALSGLPAITLRKTKERMGGGAGTTSASPLPLSSSRARPLTLPSAITRSSSHASLRREARASSPSVKPSPSASSLKGKALPSPSPSSAKGKRRTAFQSEDEKAAAVPRPVHAGTFVRYQHVLTVRHEEANALVRKYIDPAFEDQPINRGTIPGPWIIDGISEVLAAVHSCEGMLAPVLAALKRRSLRWYTMQQTTEDGDRLRLQAHAAQVKDVKAERIAVARAVREERNKRAQEPAVRLVIYRKHKDASQAVRLYKELVQGEAKRRNWQDIIEILQAVSEEPLFRGTTVYLAAVLAAALKCAGDVAVNRGLEADGGKFSDAKPHADWDGGHGNPDEISLLLQVETGDGSFSSSKLAVTVLGWASKYFIQLERESFCDALRACTIPGGWKDAMFVYKAMKQAGHSMSAPVFDIMTLVCRNTFGKQRGKLYEALKSAGASYALCFMAANTDGV